MKIKFYAHASFRLEADGLVVITDPYAPGPQNSGFDSIDEPADIVIMSSATDDFHSDPSHVRGDPTVVNALELPAEGAHVRGLHIRPFPAMESMTFDFGRDPDANALYLFTLGGLRVLHMGDIGNPVPREHLDALRGNVDLLFALKRDRGATLVLVTHDLNLARLCDRMVRLRSGQRRYLTNAPLSRRKAASPCNAFWTLGLTITSASKAISTSRP